MKDIVIGKVWLQKNSIQCTIPREMANEMNLNPGDSIKFVYNNDERLGQSVTITKVYLNNL